MFFEKKYINKYETALRESNFPTNWEVKFDAAALDKKHLDAHFLTSIDVKNPNSIITGIILSYYNNQNIGPQIRVYANGQQSSYDAFGEYKNYNAGMFVRLTLCKGSAPLKIEIGTA